jgi:hypothetical protein
MKLIDVMLVGFTIMFLIIGLDHTIVSGLESGYGFFMLALVPFFVFNYRRAKRNGPLPPGQPPKSSRKAGKR